MTKKDYEMFADMLRAIPSAASRLYFAEHLIRVLREDNSRFSEEKFRRASCCVVDSDGCYDKTQNDR